MKTKWVKLEGMPYPCDAWTNITPKITNMLPRKLHNQKNHPLWLLKQRIYRHLDHQSIGLGPRYTLVDDLSPVVTCKQNFDSLLVPQDHVSRLPKDTYYINEHTLLRSHTSAHQNELLASGLNAFLVAGDVYRRDDIDRTHYPAFHQMEGVRLFTADQLFRTAIDPSGCLELLDPREKIQLERPMQSDQLSPDKQPCHTYETLNRLEFELKSSLEDLARKLFGQAVKMRWVDAYFPFTHPSWELEICTLIGDSQEEQWMETLGCGIMRQEILLKNGVHNKVGYAFGLGLERWAMHLYRIPDIRLFWSQDSGFLSQFQVEDVDQDIVFKPISVYPQLPMDISFWLPSDNAAKGKAFARDWYDIIREIAGDLVEQVHLVDTFTHPKTGRLSHCYRIIYRHHSKSLTMDEVRPIHQQMGSLAAERLGVSIR
ncbi:Phenylalanyl-tRNA synthetase [Cichlidogyrus casuarinus]|uniref:phenylalanine--tRNA ligase n=1 Tax=Cichlidogyrus casuarinus TaxID=1844966 RepID=A0ABD2QJH4_9PLAT